MPERIHVEVAYAEPQRQFLRGVSLWPGATVADAIRVSELGREWGIDVEQCDVGVWSKPVTRDAVVREGDRIELYRALKADPKEARRRRAEKARGKR